MNIIKIILAILGIILGVMVFFWLIGVVYSLIWYLFWIGVIGAIGYGGYKLFKRAENKYVGGGTVGEIGDTRDFDMSWEEYDKKYLHK